YRELAYQAAAMAGELRAAGIASGDTVAVALERAPRAVIALLALLQIGAAYLPLDPAYPRERLQFMLEDAGAPWVLTSAAQQAAFGPSQRLVTLDDWPRAGLAAAATSPAEPVPAAANPDAPAYVMYTSGSTGTPKGIVIPHRAILRLVLDARYVDLSPAQAVLHAAPLGFDASTFEIWGALLNGGRCVLYPDELPSGPGLARVIREEGVTTAWLTAALFNAVVDDDPLHLQGLQQLLTGGEALSVPHVRRALAALPGVQLINGYGPTECTTFTATHRIPASLPAELRSIPIGRPITDTTAQVLGPTLQRLPAGLVGELLVGGPGVALGYLKRPELTAQKFLPDPWAQPGGRLYRTGDLVRWLPDGTLEFIGRNDAQVKVRGFRIELGDIEAALATHPAVQACAVAARQDGPGETRLVAYAVAAGAPVPAQALRSHLAATLPDFMLPARFVWLPALPITPNGKLDRRALPAPSVERPEIGPPYQEPVSPAEARLCEAFAEVLGLDRVGRLDNFFELGGNSLGVLRVLARLAQAGEAAPLRLSTTDFFRQPTPRGLAGALDAGAPAAARRSAAPRASASGLHEPIALIAMAGRFPGAQDVEQLWANLCEGRESITFFEPGELDASLPASLTSDPAYVRARGVIDGVGLFDAAFFGISPKEAALMDPQQRLFLEICWECLERGGYAPDACPGPVGVFAGMYNASYYQQHLAGRPELIAPVGEFAVMLANEKDYIATRVAHRLNLTGPAVSLNTACSTSLVAIVQAMASLRLGQCDMALAGGASVTCPPRSGYLYQEGAMLSPDGHTRSLAGGGQGTVFSDGAGVVLLKRLSDALADGDPVYAVIRGGAINNDGGDKASFTAPSVEGQAAVIEAALRDAGVDARSISYVEAHGTATPMGDPVEIAALTQAYRSHTADSGYCAIGSVKSNLGHMVVAAGAAGVIKTALSLAEAHLPASLHYTGEQDRIDFAATPFVVNRQLAAWPRGEQPRRAGVSSFGVGGTNAHVVLEEAPPLPPAEPSRGPQLL
ncbi:MAG TPA: amino acid adenylation domain-containing protein, partial [Ideonella sp.]|nr:amino acid adenylation domain-containing protein [Ideonella sp.]